MSLLSGTSCVWSEDTSMPSETELKRRAKMTTSSQLLMKTRKKAKQQLWREGAERVRNEIAMGVIFKLTD